MNRIARKYYAEILLAVILIIFILCKLSALTLPYFWDELGVYSRAGLYLHDHGLSLLPAALPSELSRGHPLLFSFITGLSYTLFGPSVETGHSIALLFSVLFIITMYCITRKYFNACTALAVSVCVLMQPLFVAQSIMVLPEIMLALGIWLSIYFYSKKRMLLYVLFSSFAMLIKETAIIIPGVVIIADLIIALASKRSVKMPDLKRYILACFPFLVFGVFLCIQKQQNGWYFFPYHADAVSLSLKPMVHQFTDFSKFLVMEQGRVFVTLLILFMYPVMLLIQWRQRNPAIKYNITLYLLAIAQGIFLYNDYDAAYCLLFVVSALLSGQMVLRKNNLPPFVVYCIILTGAGLGFSATNFYMNRYIIFLLPALFILYQHAVQPFFRNNFVVSAVLIIWCAVFAVINMRSKSFYYDEDMSYENYLQLQQQVIQYMEPRCTGKNISIFANFPMYHTLTDSRLGFTEKVDDVDFHLIKGNTHPTIFNYIIIAEPGSYNHSLPAADSIAIDREFTNATGKVTVYKAIYK